MLVMEKSQKCLIVCDVQSHVMALRQPSKFHILLERKNERINDKEGIMKSMKYFYEVSGSLGTEFIYRNWK